MSPENPLHADSGLRTRHLRNARVLDARYNRFDVERNAHRAGKDQAKRSEQAITKARVSDAMEAFSKRVKLTNHHLCVIIYLPVIEPRVAPIFDQEERVETEIYLHSLLASYAGTLPFEPHPLSESSYADMVIKPVGLGNVGTWAWMVPWKAASNIFPGWQRANQDERGGARLLCESTEGLEGFRQCSHDAPDRCGAVCGTLRRNTGSGSFLHRGSCRLRRLPRIRKPYRPGTCRRCGAARGPKWTELCGVPAHDRFRTPSSRRRTVDMRPIFEFDTRNLEVI
ncbi:DUF2252 family protein [Paeniglutamicibacter cryotolerans]|uniref:DUF2252 family protein n=1 Tax=Paeniglutamicibacter cryotolerans TaxID=670079 RepID=UPI003CD09542